ncbi:MAG: nitroreductase family deazaflavin-dependent oxidoreductase [Gammaproteobacteria bacterium]|nr:nitroreductase family deazaflavin-dependent oxidoreductase [Gammaproteobacteria bacterium]
MSEAYLPPTIDWVAKQVELYEGSGGTEGTTLLDTGLPCILVKVDEGYVLIGSYGGAPKDPTWVANLRANPDITLRDRTEVFELRAREITDPSERQRLYDAGIAVFPPYADYAKKTDRVIPVFLTEPR